MHDIVGYDEGISSSLHIVPIEVSLWLLKMMQPGEKIKCGRRSFRRNLYITVKSRIKGTANDFPLTQWISYEGKIYKVNNS